MTDTKSPPGPLALGAALAIIKALGSLEPLRHRADPVTAGELAEVIQGAMNATVVRKAIEEAMAEIESCHGDMLTEEARGDSAERGWARVHDKLVRARKLLEGGTARDTRTVDELEAMDLMASALAARHGQPQLKFREEYQTEAETALRALLTQYHLVRKA